MCGQSLNLVLTLAMAWLMYGVLFTEASNELIRKSAEKEAKAAAGAKP